MTKTYEITKLPQGGWIVHTENGKGVEESAHSSRDKALSRIFFKNPHVQKFIVSITEVDNAGQ